MHLACFQLPYLIIVLLVILVLYLINTRKPAPFIVYKVNSDTNSTSRYIPTIYGITPTYARLTQEPDLIRLSQTLMLVKNFHWIVVEDSETKTDLVSNILHKSSLKYTHLNVETVKSKKNSRARGVEQRNLALDWLRMYLNCKRNKRGVVYFMDDDNTYSLELFDEIRKVKYVGVWPVGFIRTRTIIPIVINGRVTGFNYPGNNNLFPVDMAGFAINARLFQYIPEAKFSREAPIGHQESEILKYFTTLDELEPLAEGCTKVYAWHTRTC